MPDTDTTAVLDAPAAVAASPESAQDTGSRPYQRVDFDSLFDETPADPPAALSESAAPAADPAPKPATDDKPAAGDEPASVKASEEPAADPSTPDEASRRKNVGAEKDAEIARLTAERAQLVADHEAALKAARGESTPEQDQAALSATAQADADRFNYLNSLASDDPVLLEVVGEGEAAQSNWDWLDGQKKLFKQVPALERRFRLEAQREIEAVRSEAEVSRVAVLNGVANDFRSLSELPGIEVESFKKLPTTQDLGRAIHAAGVATGRAELATENSRLQKENEDLRSAALGSARAPTTAGRSAGSTTEAPAFNVRKSWRENMDDALS